MKRITYDEWNDRYEIHKLDLADIDSEISDDPVPFTFFDNGAVCNEDGDYVVKCEDVKEK